MRDVTTAANPGEKRPFPLTSPAEPVFESLLGTGRRINETWLGASAAEYLKGDKFWVVVAEI